MPCAAPPRGFTDAKFPWYDPIQNNPCGLPIVTGVGGVDVSAQNLCLFHYEQKYGLSAVPAPARYDPAVALMLHGDSLYDDKGHLFTPSGGAAVSTAQSKFGGSSLYLPGGANDYFSTPDSDDWAFGSGDFTIEMQIRFSSVAPAEQTFASIFTTPNSAFIFSYSLANGLRFTWSADGTGTWTQYGVWAPVINTWYHIAVVRAGGTLYLFADGVLLSNGAFTGGVVFNSILPLLIGVRTAGLMPLNGWLDEVRISRVARWTASFTPPTAPYN